MYAFKNVHMMHTYMHTIHTFTYSYACTYMSRWPGPKHNVHVHGRRRSLISMDVTYTKTDSDWHGEDISGIRDKLKVGC